MALVELRGVSKSFRKGEETITPEYDPLNLDIRLDQLLENTADESARSNIRNRAIDYTKRKSINFIGVKKERAPDQKQHFYDPENLTLSYSYNEVNRHNFEIEKFKDQLVNSAADYTFAFQPKAVEPFKKSKRFSKSNYWKLLSDFNFNYLPTNISFSTNINRQFNQRITHTFGSFLRNFLVCRGRTSAVTVAFNTDWQIWIAG